MLPVAPQIIFSREDFTLVQYCHKQDIDHLEPRRESEIFSQERAFVKRAVLRWTKRCAIY